MVLLDLIQNLTSKALSDKDKAKKESLERERRSALFDAERNIDIMILKAAKQGLYSVNISLTNNIVEDIVNKYCEFNVTFTEDGLDNKYVTFFWSKS